MILRNAIMALAMIGTIEVAVAQQGTLVPRRMPEGHEVKPFPPMSSEVIIPLKWVGGNWVAPFDLINMDAPVFSAPGPQMGGGGMPQLGGFPPSSGSMQELVPEKFDEKSDGLPEGVTRRYDDVPGEMFVENVPYVPDYLIIDMSGEFVVSLTEKTIEDLELTGTKPLMVASHFGFMTPVPVEMLQIYGDEKDLKAITARNEKILDGGEIVGALGRPFLEIFHAVLNQDARTLTLTLPNQNGRRR